MLLESESTYGGDTIVVNGPKRPARKTHARPALANVRIESASRTNSGVAIFPAERDARIIAIAVLLDSFR